MNKSGKTGTMQNAEIVPNSYIKLDNNDAELSIASSTPDRAYDSNIQLQVGWFQTKPTTIDNDFIKILASWYCTENYTNANVYLAFGSTKNKCKTLVPYNGLYDDTRAYYKNIVVKFRSNYYKCIKTHTEAKTPTDTEYWTSISMPDLTGVVADYDNTAIIPTDFDAIVRVTSDEGNVFNYGVGDAYDGWYVTICGCATWRTVVTIDGVSSDSYSSEGYAVHLDDPLNFYRINSTPSVTYNGNTKRLNISNYTENLIMEFYRTDGYNPTGYSERVRNEFYLSTILDTESGYGHAYGNMGDIHRWYENSTYTVGVNYYDNNNKNTIKAAINSALSAINSIMSEFNIRFNISDSATTGDITILVGSHYDMFGYNPTDTNWINGTWETSYDRSGYITSAEVRIRNDGAWHCTYEDVVLEEIYQCLGAGFDQTDYITNTINSNFSYKNKTTTINNDDANILRLLYSQYISVGMNARDTAVAINPTNGAMIISSIQSLSFLPAGTYKIKVYDFEPIQDSYNSDFFWGRFSYPAELNITISGDSRPSNWAWTTNIVQGGDLPYSSGIGYYVVTASEWNNFTDRVNEFRRYKGLSDYSFSTATRGNNFTATVYNQAVNAIKGISGYGTHLSTVSSGDNILASHFLLLRDELNAIP